MRREDGRAGCIRSLLWSRGRAIHLVRQGAGGFNIEVTNCDIKSFERVTRKYGVDFALKKDTTETPPRYLVFFKGQDADERKGQALYGMGQRAAGRKLER